jgi:hypothetical protein
MKDWIVISPYSNLLCMLLNFFISKGFSMVTVATILAKWFAHGLKKKCETCGGCIVLAFLAQSLFCKRVMFWLWDLLEVMAGERHLYSQSRFILVCCNSVVNFFGQLTVCGYPCGAPQFAFFNETWMIILSAFMLNAKQALQGSYLHHIQWGSRLALTQQHNI